MIIIDKNEGKKISYFLSGNKITFDDELMINLEKYERDDPNHIDICRDSYGNLVMGVIPGIAERYVAQIDIPAREYEHEKLHSFSYDDMKENKITPIPFDIDNCVLTLWALNGGTTNE